MNHYLTKIITLLAGITAIVKEAAAVYVRACEEHEDWREFFRKNAPQVNGHMLEMIGRDKVHAAFYGVNQQVFERLSFLPMRVQQQIVDKGIAVVYEDGTSMTISASALNPTLANRAIADGKLRSVKEQRELMLKSRNKNVERGRLYTIHSKSEATVGNRRVTYEQICEIKELMEKFGDE